MLEWWLDIHHVGSRRLFTDRSLSFIYRSRSFTDWSWFLVLPEFINSEIDIDFGPSGLEPELIFLSIDQESSCGPSGLELELVFLFDRSRVESWFFEA